MKQQDAVDFIRSSKWHCDDTLGPIVRHFVPDTLQQDAEIIVVGQSRVEAGDLISTSLRYRGETRPNRQVFILPLDCLQAAEFGSKRRVPH